MTTPKNTRRTALGRGLDSLIPDPDAHYNDPADESSGRVLAIDEISVDLIEPNPYQPRTRFDEDALQELTESIRTQGIIQPITVRRLAEQQYQLIAGERRLKAAKRAGLQSVPAYVRTANDEQMIEFALIENIQRQDLNPLEIAIGYKRLMEECNLILEQVGDKVGKKRSTVNNYLRLLKLPADVQIGLREETLSMGHARALLGLENASDILKLYRQTIDNGLSVRQVEDLVRQLQKPADAQLIEVKPAPTPYEIQLRDVQQQLAQRYGTRVRIQSGSKGTGEIRLSYFSDDDLNRLLALLEQ